LGTPAGLIFPEKQTFMESKWPDLFLSAPVFEQFKGTGLAGTPALLAD